MNSSHPVVSVVIPCYNAETWILETLNSVIGQPGVDLDIVLVDDGSTDRSVAVAQAMGAPMLRIIRQANDGASRARNVGTAAARGEFIQYLDADDVLEPGTLAARVNALRAAEADVAYCNWLRWERQAGGSFAVGQIVTRTLGSRPDVDLLTDAWWPPGALMYRRAVVDRVLPWREDLPVIQDARFQLDAALSGAHFVHVDAIGLKYRVHTSDSLSHRDPRAFLEDVYNNVSDLHAGWLKADVLDEPRRRGLIRVYRYLATALFSIDRARFKQVLAAVRRLDPNYRPEGSAVLRTLSSLVGYSAAEEVAARWRRLRYMATK